MYEVEALFLYSGYSSYWCGDSERWEDNKGCLFTFYDHTTTLPELIEGWMEDFLMGGDCDSFPEEIETDQIKQALIDMLSPLGKVEYKQGDNAPICEMAEEFLDNNPELKNMNEEQLKEFHQDELPMAVVLIRVTETEGVKDV